MPSRVVGSKGREVVYGRPIEGGRPVGSSKGTRVIYAPPVARTYDHCEDLNKEGLPCGAPNVTGEPYCIGHKRSREARERAAQ